MQTFLPYPNFKASAKVLDRQRLGKQRVETLQLLKALADGGAWSNHPACKMWRGSETCLIVYGIVICNEWVSRGYKDTCRDKIREYTKQFGTDLTLPPWLSNPDFHASHRSNLLRKDREWYSRFGWGEPDDIPYIWPEGLS